MPHDRSWMYNGRRKRGEYTDEWMQKTTEFVDLAFSRDTGEDGVLCPCNYCGNTQPQMRSTMITHLCRHGFRPDYSVWVYHGESEPSRNEVLRQRTEETAEHEAYHMEDMIDDVRDAHVSLEDESPEPTAQAFYAMLSASTQPLHAHIDISQLDAITRLLTVKSQFGVTIAAFDAFLSVFGSLLPQGHKLPPNLYEAKKFLKALSMPYEKIDVCPNNCMLFRKEADIGKDHCDKCGECRYVEVQSSDGQKKQLPVAKKVLRYLPFIPRLQRLYMSENQTKYMTWHKYGHRYHPNNMVHPSDSEAWKQFDKDFPSFATDARKILEKREEGPVSEIEAYAIGRMDEQRTYCNRCTADRIAAYSKAIKEKYGEDYDWQNAAIDGEVVYKAGHGKRHGRYLIGNGMISTTTLMSDMRSSTNDSLNGSGPSKRLRLDTESTSMEQIQSEMHEMRESWEQDL